VRCPHSESGMRTVFHVEHDQLWPDKYRHATGHPKWLKLPRRSSSTSEEAKGGTGGLSGPRPAVRVAGAEQVDRTPGRRGGWGYLSGLGVGVITATPADPARRTPYQPAGNHPAGPWSTPGPRAPDPVLRRARRPRSSGERFAGAAPKPGAGPRKNRAGRPAGTGSSCRRVRRRR